VLIKLLKKYYKYTKLFIKREYKLLLYLRKFKVIINLKDRFILLLIK
jgi:hypothetical protein